MQFRIDTEAKEKCAKGTYNCGQCPAFECQYNKVTQRIRDRISLLEMRLINKDMKELVDGTIKAISDHRDEDHINEIARSRVSHQGP